MEQNEWIALSYTLPREPSRTRVLIWRKLKKIGAVNLQSLWMLPSSAENHSLLAEIRQKVSENGGEAFLLSFSAEDDRGMIVSSFNSARDEEYRELLEQCEEFFKEIDKETARENFTFAEIEENEEELDKLKKWYEKISARDSFGAPLQEKAADSLLRCTKALEEFCDNVYEFNEKCSD